MARTPIDFVRYINYLWRARSILRNNSPPTWETTKNSKFGVRFQLGWSTEARLWKPQLKRHYGILRAALTISWLTRWFYSHSSIDIECKMILLVPACTGTLDLIGRIYYCKQLLVTRMGNQIHPHLSRYPPFFWRTASNNMKGYYRSECTWDLTTNKMIVASWWNNSGTRADGWRRWLTSKPTGNMTLRASSFHSSKAKGINSYVGSSQLHTRGGSFSGNPIWSREQDYIAGTGHVTQAMVVNAPILTRKMFLLGVMHLALWRVTLRFIFIPANQRAFISWANAIKPVRRHSLTNKTSKRNKYNNNHDWIQTRHCRWWRCR